MTDNFEKKVAVDGPVVNAGELGSSTFSPGQALPAGPLGLGQRWTVGMAQPENLVGQRPGAGLAVAQYPHLPVEPKGLAGQLLRGLPDALRPLLLLVEARVQPGVLLVPPDHLLVERRSSVRSDLTVSFWSGEGSRTVRRRGGAGHGPVAPSRAFDAARALRSRAFSLRSAPAVSKADAMPASERSVSRRATSACKDGTSLAVRRASFVSSTASLSLRRQALNRDFHEPPSLRAATSAQRSSSARAPAPTRGTTGPRHYPRPASSRCQNPRPEPPCARR